MGQGKSVDELRREVDSLDDALVALMARRAALTAEIAATKPREGGRIPLARAMRPAREAEIMRRLAARHTGAPPLATVIRVFREILAASLAAQVPFRLHVPSRAPELAALARGYFGSLAPLVHNETVTRLINACGDDPDSIGVVPAVESADMWWSRLAPSGTAGPRVIARLPFLVEGADAPYAYAIGAIEHEPTGDDTTLLLAEVAPSVSRTRMVLRLRQAGIEGRVIAGSPGAERKPVLIEANGFVGRNDTRLTAFAAEGEFAGSTIVPVGGFANPLRVEAKETVW